MSDLGTISGQKLVVLDKKRTALLMYLLAALALAGAIVPLVFGVYLALVAATAVPLLVWLARSLGSTRLVVTSDGIYHVRGRGLSQTPAVVGSTDWASVNGIKLVSEQLSNADDTTTTTHTLVVSRRGEKPLRYPVGWRQDDRLARIARLCEQREIPAQL